MRVVQDATRTDGTRAGNPKATDGGAQRASVNAVGGAVGAGAAGKAGGAGASAARTTLPMLQAGLFLFACLIGGVAVALFQPF